ncbi:TPA: Asp-tRNA(Asn)/Glu-tRNA(Gln) amidotransferase subunit GatB [Candidatus Latescibacteria bacterium]|nr:Asp-tRNA(Asn)/Glu-tRNA(Gln) amidotransferase GatCAB subunit C [Gemmatimonadota bacterium]HAA76565.1 Asp-tRNA(Asn)/Glu-tRNA(Gln) amidotransferase subunit GatB [Candidatus Latescibacterota bacterium]|tara:strand:- start:154 stop:441 length:288 start_codon:yes stop_codon:yes gene_type:complete
MSVTRDDVQRVARLARLKLTEPEESRLVSDLNHMLAYVAALEELDTSQVTPTAHVLPLSNVFRPDEPTEALSLEAALSNAPRSRHGHFRVPKVIE